MQLSTSAALSLSAVLVLVAAPARGTYSIVAVDGATMHVGGTGTSCVGSFVSIYSIYGSVPGTGAVHAQALLSTRNRDRAVELMQMGESPEAILAAVTDPSFDSRYDRRQYGIVDLSPSAVGFTGASTLDYAGDVQGTVGVFTYSVQGNILTSRAVIDQARAAFEASGCDLADRLMRALEAGADGGEGDSRCTPDGIPSDGAFLQVDRPDEPRGTWLSLRIDDTEPESPLVLLRAEYDAWRADNPCPAPPTPDAGLDAGAAGDAGPVGTDAGFPRDSGRLDASRRLDAGPPAAGTDDGCSCIAAGRPAGEPRGGAGLVACAALAALWLVHRRRW